MQNAIFEIFYDEKYLGTFLPPRQIVIFIQHYSSILIYLLFVNCAT